MLKVRLYPEAGSTRFVRAFVWPTRRAMRAATRTSRETVGLCRRGDPARKDRCVAEVHLSRARMGTQVVTHEMFHATLAYALYVGIPLHRVSQDAVTATEERLAHAHSTLCHAFVRVAYAVGLYDV